MRTLAGPGLRKGGMHGLARIAQMTCTSLRIRRPGLRVVERLLPVRPAFLVKPFPSRSGGVTLAESNGKSDHDLARAAISCGLACFGASTALRT
jgi:hypothetical protein